jgi:5-methylcytosine-specific restriction endonuclease McrA
VSHTLLLNADAQPVSYLPLSAIKWKEAITYLWLDKVTVLEWYDDWMVHSATWETKVPAVMMLKDMQRRRQKPRFSKANLYVRDVYTCQYCNTPYTKQNLTLDHVVPLSLGGKTSWANIVAACGPCNNRKGNKTQLEMQIAHPSWNAYL